MNENTEYESGRKRKERRYKILSVDIRVIMELLCPASDGYTISKLKLPEDVNPITVHYSLDRQSFLFLLESESFPPVEPGAEIPYLNGEWLRIPRMDENYQTDKEYVKMFKKEVGAGME